MNAGGMKESTLNKGALSLNIDQRHPLPPTNIIMARNHAQRIASIAKKQNLTNALGGLKDDTFASIHKALQVTGTPRITIHRHLNGGLSKHEAQCSHQLLSPEEEQYHE